MKCSTRRQIGVFLKRFLLALVVSAVTGGASADQFPHRPIKIIVPYGGGGSMDVVGRAVAQEMSRDLGVRVFVENRPGAAGTVGLGALAQALPDGYTLGLGSASTLAVVVAAGVPRIYDPVTSFAPIGMIGSAPFLVVASSSVATSSLAELIELAQAKPGQLTFSSVGEGSIVHFAGERFKAMAGVDLLHVPYSRMTEARMDLLAGRIHVMFDQPATFSRDEFDTGRLKALAVMAKSRHPQFQEVPTTAEAGLPGLEVETWFALLAPAGTPAGVVAQLNRALGKALEAEPVTRVFAHKGFIASGGPPASLAARIDADIKTWAAIAHATGFHGTGKSN